MHLRNVYHHLKLIGQALLPFCVSVFCVQVLLLHRGRRRRRRRRPLGASQSNRTEPAESTTLSFFEHAHRIHSQLIKQQRPQRKDYSNF